MSRVYWDSMLFIYLIEGNPDYAPRVRSIYRAMEKRGDTLCTSVFTLGEVLTGPRKLGAADVVSKVRDFFLQSSQVELIPFTVATADQYSEIRGSTGAKPADAIHLASAADFGVELFLTHDKSLHRLAIPGIHFIAGLDVSLY
ncbi:MAG TPA: PIN domain-containing protein [Terracidiphilus sp.]|jgi:predicted nucleic acid-binding protein|nr:PIN domain-containing protein [Terracidiphilus sp.]